METSENRDNLHVLGGALLNEAEASDNHEPSLWSILAAINSLHVKCDQHTTELRGVQKLVTELEERLATMEDCVEQWQGAYQTCQLSICHMKITSKF